MQYLGFLLTPSTHTPEGIAPGDDRGGVGGGGAVPTRYQVTNRGQLALATWNNRNYIYCLMQINKGNNPIGNLQVVSTLNTLNLSHEMLHYNYANSLERYYPKVYFGTNQTIALSWIIDAQNYAGSDIKYPSIWPEKKSQKGE